LPCCPAQKVEQPQWPKQAAPQQEEKPIENCGSSAQLTQTKTCRNSNKSSNADISLQKQQSRANFTGFDAMQSAAYRRSFKVLRRKKPANGRVQAAKAMIKPRSSCTP
jgi:hypothetical protein